MLVELQNTELIRILHEHLKTFAPAHFTFLFFFSSLFFSFSCDLFLICSFRQNILSFFSLFYNIFSLHIPFPHLYLICKTALQLSGMRYTLSLRFHSHCTTGRRAVSTALYGTVHKLTAPPTARRDWSSGPAKQRVLEQ